MMQLLEFKYLNEDVPEGHPYENLWIEAEAHTTDESFDAYGPGGGLYTNERTGLEIQCISVHYMDPDSGVHVPVPDHWLSEQPQLVESIKDECLHRAEDLVWED